MEKRIRQDKSLKMSAEWDGGGGKEHSFTSLIWPPPPPSVSIKKITF